MACMTRPNAHRGRHTDVEARGTDTAWRENVRRIRVMPDRARRLQQFR